MKLIVKYFFLADILFLLSCLRFGKIHISLADVFYFFFFWGGGFLRSESSCIQVNMVLF